MNSARGRVVGPAVAGTWYPAAPPALEREVEQLLAAQPAPPATPRVEPAALIAPHAGYVYSGAVAAAGFSRLRGLRVARVVLLGPSHYEAFDGGAVPEADAYRTPLGDVPLDAEALDGLRRAGGLRSSSRPFVPEHCLEAELPFLQRVLPEGWRLVPVLVGAGSSRDSLERLARALSDWTDAATLVVVSSDFTHYGARFGYVPFHDDVPRRIRELDLGAAERITALDPAGFERFADDTGATICGRQPISVLLRLLPRDTTGDLVAYDTSGRMTGDWSHSVSYASLVFGRPAAPPAGARA